ncbi:DUF4328 domain-containing protein [Streptomyces sp. NPDC059134]|uniref:protein kinase domain-containing protein n=1 Tax=Streptomyces sp. NPDC059134 TaxID=3346738 RepID=UPI0036CBF3A1
MDALEPGDPERIGTYRLLGRLGEGGMGRVYLARSDRGRTVAVKTVREELARTPAFRQRFAQEVKAAQRVGGEWTAPVLDADVQAPVPWLATGYVAGPSLTDVVHQQYGPLPPASLEVLAVGLLRALKAIHGAGLVHRDLKPSNVLVTIDGPRVIDFGIARALDAATQSVGGLTGPGAVLGSPGFMSPEQVRGEEVSYASDVFCLGAVLAYAATGRTPFGTGDSGAHALLFRIATEEPDLSGIAAPWYGLIASCLEKEPGKRPTPDELLAAVEELPGADATSVGAWLPGEVLAALGRHAVQLLDHEAPENRVPVGAPVVGFGPPVLPYHPPVPPWQGHTPFGAVPGVMQPPPYHAPPAPRTVRPAKKLAAALYTFLVVNGLALVFQVAFLDEAYYQLTEVPADSPIESIGNFAGLRMLNSAIDGFTLLMQLVVPALWVCWFHHVRQNAECFAPGRIRYGPGLAAGSWFIPVVNFFMPKQIANDIWTATTGRPSGEGRWLLHLWWWFWLAHFLTYWLQLQYWTDQKSAGAASELVIEQQLTALLGILSTALALFFAVRLTSQQQRRAAGTA